MRWTRAALLTRVLACGRRSRVVLTPRRRRQVLEKQASCEFSWGRRWQQSPITGESAKQSLKPLRAGMPGDPGATVVTNARAFYPPRAAAGATGTRHSPRPHWANDFRHNSGAMRRENAEAYLAVIARGKATKQSILTSRLIASRNLSSDGAFARPVGSQSRLTERHHALVVKKASR
jgi:hypothetical protein